MGEQINQQQASDRKSGVKADPATLSSRLNHRNNSLNLVRLALAAVVVLGHAWPLTGSTAQPSLEFLSGIAVNGFFAVSGYLIAGSRVRTSFTSFIWRRALRIFPAFLACLLLIALCFGPIGAAISGQSYQWDSAFSFVYRNAMLSIEQRAIEGSLEQVPYEGAWNGSLWTLKFEFIAYVLMGLVLTGTWIRQRARIVVPILFILLVLGRVLALGPLDVTTNFYLFGLRLAGYFVAGAALYFWADRISLRPRYTAAALIIFIGLWMVNGAELFGQIPLSYLILSLGAIRCTGFAAKEDISYGMYIYAFPVQQTLVLLGTSNWGIVANTVLTLIITAGLAWISWKYLEKPCLAFKRLIQGPQRLRSTQRGEQPNVALRI